MLQAMMEMQSGESAYERQKRKGRGGKEETCWTKCQIMRVHHINQMGYLFTSIVRIPSGYCMK